MGAVEEALHLSMEKTQHLLLLPISRNPLKIVWVILSAPIVASWVLQRLQAEGLVRQSRTILRGWVGNLEPFGLLDC